MKRLVCMVMMLLAGVASAAALDVTVTAQVSGGGDYRTIGEALAAVASVGGGTVTVNDSEVYAENIPTGTYAWTITVRAGEGQEPTLRVGTVTAGYWEAFFYMQGNGQHLIVDGFKVEAVVDAQNFDGKLLMTHGQNQRFTASHCVFTGLVNRYLIRMDGTVPKVTLQDNRFFMSYDTATYVESALVGMVADGAELTVERCTYVQDPSGGVPAFYGVIWCDHESPTITLRDSIFEDHSSSPQAVVHVWAATTDKGTVTMTNCNYPQGYAAADITLEPAASHTLLAALSDPAGGDFTLTGNSPCIQAGSGQDGAVNMGWDQTATFSAIAGRIRNIRSFTYYPFPASWGAVDLDDFSASLDGIAALGGNTVWLVLPWINFQSASLPTASWNMAALTQLEEALDIAEAKGFDVFMPLNYLGVGWAPTGIDAHNWATDPAQFAAFVAYAKQFMGFYKHHSNLIVLLFTESVEPYYATLRDYASNIESFKNYCLSVNTDIAYWNARWGTSYTWDTILPASVPWEGGLRTTDHYRWASWLVRQTLNDAAAQLKAVSGFNAPIGLHDYLVTDKRVDVANVAFPATHAYDFMSLPHYYNGAQLPGTDLFDQELREDCIAVYANNFPDLPIVFGETGACASQVGQEVQGEVARVAATVCLDYHVGVNFWMWQDFTEGDACQASFGFLDVSGDPKPNYVALSTLWAPSDPGVPVELSWLCMQ